jgi:hypothetical protein
MTPETDPAAARRAAGHLMAADLLLAAGDATAAYERAAMAITAIGDAAPWSMRAAVLDVTVALAGCRETDYPLAAPQDRYRVAADRAALLLSAALA